MPLDTQVMIVDNEPLYSIKNQLFQVSIVIYKINSVYTAFLIRLML